MPVILIKALNVTHCSSHRTPTPSFLPMGTMVWGRRGAEETTRVLSHSESIYTWDVHFAKDQERHPRLRHLDIALKSSGWQPDWQHTPVVTDKVQHVINVIMSINVLCCTQNQLCPFCLEFYHAHCEIAPGSSFIAIFLKSFSRGSCNQELGDTR